MRTNPNYKRYLLNKRSQIIGYIWDRYKTRFDVEAWRVCHDGKMRAAFRCLAVPREALNELQMAYIRANDIAEYFPRNPIKDPKEGVPYWRDDFYDKTLICQGAKY